MVGIICEYNPFHNGHLYHLNKVKELFPNEIITLVLGGNFLNRGDVSVINKWNKTKLALDYGIDLVVELPFIFATQSADIYAYGAISILENLKCNYIVFGSELNDIDTLYKVIIKSIPKDIIASDSETLDGLLNGSDEKNKCVKITLPCEVGSSVYAIIERKLHKCRVESYIIDSGNTSTVYLSYKQNINGKEE